MTKKIFFAIPCKTGQSYYPDALPELKCPALFQIPYKDASFDGADVTFCNKWRAIGGEIWAYTGEFTEHVGKKSYAGTYGSSGQSK